MLHEALHPLSCSFLWDSNSYRGEKTIRIVASMAITSSLAFGALPYVGKENLQFLAEYCHQCILVRVWSWKLIKKILCFVDGEDKDAAIWHPEGLNLLCWCNTTRRPNYVKARFCSLKPADSLTCPSASMSASAPCPSATSLSPRAYHTPSRTCSFSSLRSLSWNELT
ncbi:hypothetical protein M427DRAFT_277732 [Gonapodya prolifera JEL478]|uniref:Uncharacterized protein n=1 Tax=Gonapodya prolifera (strain JEL478) TaxID=1344416 RepID=A0A139AYF7_GONPJ|nr:hypothetical protein M427DRAFT_277732 [Gonapodya prolifera JEL478]|eukprot:KXS21744.1 hypothetical protein M427DRAFT_277732 [Gonapodya prolifera JEL478]